MNNQPEALRLLKHMESEYATAWNGRAIKAELRRLHEIEVTYMDSIDTICSLAVDYKKLNDVNQELVEALQDMLSGWKYIREAHGDLYGVGWDRAESKAQAALAKAGEST